MQLDGGFSVAAMAAGNDSGKYVSLLFRQSDLVTLEARGKSSEAANLSKNLRLFSVRRDPLSHASSI